MILYFIVFESEEHVSHIFETIWTRIEGIYTVKMMELAYHDYKIIKCVELILES